MSDVQTDPNAAIAVKAADLLPVEQQMVQPPPLPIRQPDPIEERLNPTPGTRRNGKYKVWEWLTDKVEYVIDTPAHALLYAGETSLLAGRRSAEITAGFSKVAQALLRLPALLLGMYTWKRHLLTESADKQISFNGILLTTLVTIDVWAWWSTLWYAISDPGICNIIAFALASLNLLIDRAVFVADQTAGDLIPQSLLRWAAAGTSVKQTWHGAARNGVVSGIRWAFKPSRLNNVLRIVVVVVMAETNGEAIRIKLAEPETTAIAQAEDEAVARSLRNDRVAEIGAEIARRSTEADTASANSLTAWHNERATGLAALTELRRTTTTAKREAFQHADATLQAEMRTGVRSRSQIDIANRAELLRNWHEYDDATPGVIADYNTETNQGRLQREAAIAQQHADLNAEKDRRLAEARSASLETLGTASGIHTTRPRGIWSRLDALKKVHENSESSRQGDWFARCILLAIGLLPLLNKRLSNPDVKMYYSLSAHARANDGDPMCLLAQSVYGEIIAKDPSVAAFYQQWYMACARANLARINFDIAMTDAAMERDSDHLSLSKPKMDKRALEEWIKPEGLREALEELGRLMSLATNANLEVLWPLTAGEDPRSMTSAVIPTNLLIAKYGWREMSKERRDLKDLREKHDAGQTELAQAIETFRVAFPKGVTPNNIEAAHDFYVETLLPLAHNLRRIERSLRSKRIAPPTWIEGKDLFRATDAVATELGLDGAARTTAEHTEDPSSSTDTFALDSSGAPAADDTDQALAEATAEAVKAARLAQDTSRTDTQPGPRLQLVRNDPPKP